MLLDKLMHCAVRRTKICRDQLQCCKARVGKRVRSTSLYHWRQYCNI